MMSKSQLKRIAIQKGCGIPSFSGHCPPHMHVHRCPNCPCGALCANDECLCCCHAAMGGVDMRCTKDACRPCPDDETCCQVSNGQH